MAGNDAEKTGKEQSLIDPIYQKFVKGVIRAIGNTDFYEFFMDAISRADNQFQFSNRKLEKIVDIHWVDAVESALKPFENIINNPRNIIKEEELVVNIENAKKAGPETIRHLAHHAALIDEYHEDSGDIRPGRLMQRYREDTIGIYENRLVFTALETAYHFVKIRYDALLEAMNEEYGAKLKVTSELNSATELIHMDMFLHIKQIDSALETDDKNSEVFSRISRIMRVLNVFMLSDFSKQLSRLNRVRGQINKTNVLKKNKDYKKVVELFQFLREYDSIGYSIKVIEQKPVINEAFQRDIFHNIMFNYLILKGYLEDESDRVVPTAAPGRQRTLKPKFIREIIEELTENYDLPEVEIRKVFIEELTKKQLMQEEASERRRLLEEQKQRKQEEARRLKEEQAAEKERIRREKEEEKERLRREKLAAEERARQEKLEREIEDRRRSGLFREELRFFEDQLPEQLYLRSAGVKQGSEGLSDFADAADIVEETENLRKEIAARERQRRKEERQAEIREKLLAELREKEEKARLAKEKAEAEERAQREKEEQEARELEERIARDKEALAPVIEEISVFNTLLASRLAMRRKQAEDRRNAEEERERQRRERARRRSSVH